MGGEPTKSPRKGRQRIDHTDETRSFDCRNPHSKLRYFQTLLALGDLLTTNPIISSEQPQSYYELVIRGVKCDADSGDKAYRNQLKQLYGKKIPALPAPDPDFDVFAVEDGDDCEFDVAGSDDDAAECLVAKRAARPKAKQRAKRATLAIKDGANAPAASASQSSSSSSSSSSPSSTSGSGSASSAKSFDVAKGRAEGTSKWMEIERGPRIKLDVFKPRNKAKYFRWQLECTHHDGCTRKRSTAKTSIHGNVEPIAWLLAWNADGAGISIEQHSARNFPISPEAVARQVVKLGDRAVPVLALL